MARTRELLLSPLIRSALNHAFRKNNLALNPYTVREKRTRLRAAWTFANTIHWNATAFTHPINNVMFWRGVCHEMAHIHQEQAWGRLEYRAAILRGVWISFPSWWVHDRIPMEQDADRIETLTWKPARDFWREHRDQ